LRGAVNASIKEDFRLIQPSLAKELPNPKVSFAAEPAVIPTLALRAMPLYASDLDVKRVLKEDRIRSRTSNL
jgi:hypothetical protein